MKIIALLLLCLGLPVQAQPDNVVRLDGMALQGRSEEPNVLYVTPWREPPGTGRLNEEAASFSEQWLHSLDADRLQYEQRLQPHYSRSPATGQAATPPGDGH